jgi:hypothetical protein
VACTRAPARPLTLAHTACWVCDAQAGRWSWLVPAVALAGAATPFVTRCGAQLCVDGKAVRFAGLNIYWLGLDENVGGIQYPTQVRPWCTMPTSCPAFTDPAPAPPPPSPHLAAPPQFRQEDAIATAVGDLNASVVRSHTLGISTGNPLRSVATRGGGSRLLSWCCAHSDCRTVKPRIDASCRSPNCWCVD